MDEGVPRELTYQIRPEYILRLNIDKNCHMSLDCLRVTTQSSCNPQSMLACLDHLN